jgi:hypothetical protein
VIETSSATAPLPLPRRRPVAPPEAAPAADGPGQGAKVVYHARTGDADAMVLRRHPDGLLDLAVLVPGESARVIERVPRDAGQVGAWSMPGDRPRVLSLEDKIRAIEAAGVLRVPRVGDRVVTLIDKGTDHVYERLVPRRAVVARIVSADVETNDVWVDLDIFVNDEPPSEIGAPDPILDRGISHNHGATRMSGWAWPDEVPADLPPRPRDRMGGRRCTRCKELLYTGGAGVLIGGEIVADIAHMLMSAHCPARILCAGCEAALREWLGEGQPAAATA